MIERRRSPRFDVSGGEFALLPSANSVQILDISRGGVLLQCTYGARVASTGRLTTTLRGQPFSAELEVRRVDALPTGGFRVGAKFTMIDTEHSRALDAFTERGPT